MRLRKCLLLRTSRCTQKVEGLMPATNEDVEAAAVHSLIVPDLDTYRASFGTILIDKDNRVYQCLLIFNSTLFCNLTGSTYMIPLWK
jgi:hypothetical protein